MDKKKILVVEDEKAISDILVFNLQREGYDTLAAYDGAEGLRCALEEAPDLILLDVMLPGEDGLSLLRFLRRDASLDRDETLGREIYDAFTREVDADLYVLAHATSPFIRAATISDALGRVRSGEYDSAFSAECIRTFAWYEGRPLNYSLDAIPRTQTIEPVYIETSAFFIFPRELWCGRGRRIGDRPWMAVVDRIEGLDIDYPEDFAMAEIIAAGQRLPR